MTDRRELGGGRMTDKEWLTVAELSKKVGVPAETARRYIRNFKEYLKLRKDGKRYLIHKDCSKVIEKIRGLYSDGLTNKEIEEALSDSGVTMTITVKESHERMTDSVNDNVNSNVNDELKEIKKRLEKQEEFNVLLLERLEKQQQYIDERMNERDRLLINAVRESLETRQQISTTAQETASTSEETVQDKKKWWKFW